MSAAPGWYSDPSGVAGQLRWWDGTQWTGHVTPDPTATTAVEPEPEPEPVPEPEPEPGPEPEPAPEETTRELVAELDVTDDLEDPPTAPRDEETERGSGVAWLLEREEDLDLPAPQPPADEDDAALADQVADASEAADDGLDLDEDGPVDADAADGLVVTEDEPVETDAPLDVETFDEPVLDVEVPVETDAPEDLIVDEGPIVDEDPSAPAEATLASPTAEEAPAPVEEAPTPVEATVEDGVLAWVPEDGSVGGPVPLADDADPSPVAASEDEPGLDWLLEREPDVELEGDAPDTDLVELSAAEVPDGTEPDSDATVRSHPVEAAADADTNEPDDELDLDDELAWLLDPEERRQAASGTFDEDHGEDPDGHVEPDLGGAVPEAPDPDTIDPAPPHLDEPESYPADEHRYESDVAESRTGPDEDGPAYPADLDAVETTGVAPAPERAAGPEDADATDVAGREGRRGRRRRGRAWKQGPPAVPVTPPIGDDLGPGAAEAPLAPEDLYTAPVDDRDLAPEGFTDDPADAPIDAPTDTVGRPGGDNWVGGSGTGTGSGSTSGIRTAILVLVIILGIVAVAVVASLLTGGGDDEPSEPTAPVEDFEDTTDREEVETGEEVPFGRVVSSTVPEEGSYETELVIEETREVTIDVRAGDPADFDPVAEIISATGDTVAYNDDRGETAVEQVGGDFYDPYIQLELEPGVYQLIVRGFAGDTGDFELRIS